MERFNYGQKAPYAPPATVREVLGYYREHEAPEVIDTLRLGTIGVRRAVAQRVLNALQFLGLVQADGSPTARLKNLPGGNENQYRQSLTGLIRGAYVDVFRRVDPATATETNLIDAFRDYSPAGQRSRMISLFLGLCQEAGLEILATPKTRSTTQRRGGNPGRGSTRSSTVSEGAQAPGDDHGILWALFLRLPEPGVPMPQSEKEEWLATAKHALQLEHPDTQG